MRRIDHPDKMQHKDDDDSDDDDDEVSESVVALIWCEAILSWLTWVADWLADWVL